MYRDMPYSPLALDLLALNFVKAAMVRAEAREELERLEWIEKIKSAEPLPYESPPIWWRIDTD